ncbi:MAG: flagella basal body P-ring formation protein FlgA [Sulfitobacter sp.]|jgi:flagellar basal body P-ring formation protein FlgA
MLTGLYPFLRLQVFGLVIACALAVSGLADVVVPARPIRAHALIGESDLVLRSGASVQGFDNLGDVIGKEAQVVLYPGRPIMAGDIGPPAIVTRNQIVKLRFETSGLWIVTEGRALERGAIGDRLRVMNLNSRATLFGQVQPDGSIRVSY